MQEAISRN
ncbi:hypothetical protein ACHAXR_001375 [Thalassiosira sp. AJA248-18]